jgi:hypothetical protein
VSAPAVEVNQWYREELLKEVLLAVKLPVYLEYSMAGGTLREVPVWTYNAAFNSKCVFFLTV